MIGAKSAFTRDSKMCGGLMLVMMVLLMCGLVRGAEKAARPNIIVILADDVGWSDLGCMGSEIHTPNLDGLAKSGVLFTEFYNTGRCCPTRASLLTGLYPHQAGVGLMVQDRGEPGYRGQLNDHCVTIAQVLHTAGYATYGVGKWHVVRDANLRPDTPDKSAWPGHRGFDHYYGTLMGAGDYFDPPALIRDDQPITIHTDPKYKPKGQYYLTDAITDNALSYLSEHHHENAAQPFFMYVAYTAAHWPLHAKPSDIAKYKGVYDAGYGAIRKARFERQKKLGLVDPRWDLSPQFGEWSKVKDKAFEARCMEVYAAQIDCMDQGVGRIMDELKKEGEADNTLVLFLQDNGACAEGIGRGQHVHAPRKRADHPTRPAWRSGEVRYSTHPAQTRDGYPMRSGYGVMPGPEDTFVAYGEAWANVSDTPFRLYKHFNHEGGVSTPLIAHWPAGIPGRGEVVKQPGHIIDIMTTCVALASAKYPATWGGKPITPMEGRSLVPAFEGKPIQRDAIYWEHEGNRAIRVGDWKLVAKGWRGRWELYDMAADRTEMHDLSQQKPEVVKELTAKWEAWAHRAMVYPLPARKKKAHGEPKD